MRRERANAKAWVWYADATIHMYFRRVPMYAYCWRLGVIFGLEKRIFDRKQHDKEHT